MTTSSTADTARRPLQRSALAALIVLALAGCGGSDQTDEGAFEPAIFLDCSKIQKVPPKKCGTIDSGAENTQEKSG